MLSLSQKQTIYANTRSSDSAVHQYVDVDVVNNRTVDSFGSSPMVPQPLIFNQIKLQNIVDNCSDYYISVIRWSMDSIIPVIIPQIPVYPAGRATEDFPLETEYRVSFSYGLESNSPATTGPFATPAAYLPDTNTIVMFDNPDNLFLDLPKEYPRTQEEIYQNPYYHLSTVQSFLNMINRAITSAWSSVGTIESDPPGPRPIGVDPPKFIWNSTIGKIELVARREFIYFGPGLTIPDYNNNFNVARTPNFFINVNTSLYNLLSTFGFKCINPTREGDLAANSYSLYLYNVNQRFQYSTDQGNVAIEVFIYTQDNSSVPSWTPCTSLQFTTATIPVNPSATSAPLFLGDNLRSTLAASAQSNVITDFQIPLTTGTELTGQLYYAPSSEYRLFDLVTNGPLQQLNIEVTWLDKYGFSHPFLLKNGGTASLKLMLRKKIF